MRKRKTSTSDPRSHTPAGHYLKNAPWRQDFVEEIAGPSFSARDSIVLVFLAACFVVVATALWISPPKILQIKNDAAIKAQATLAGHRVPRAYNGVGYDPAKFEEVKDDDPLVQDDLEDVLTDEGDSKSTRSL